jgi:predicted deacetylase
MAKYIFRLDDLAPNMQVENYFKIKHLFDKFDIKPIVGIIPENQDPKLKYYPRCYFDFWEHILLLQKSGWEIALHGYQHKLNSNNAGLLGINPYGEFAGLPYKVQRSKLRAALNIFKKYQIQTKTFMAPAHSFDRETLRALKELKITQLSDGLALFPYRKDGISYVPQLFALPRKMLFGVFTFCIHTNTMTKSVYKRVKDFIILYRHDVITFEEALGFSLNATVQIPFEFLLKQTLKIKRTIQRI